MKWKVPKVCHNVCFNRQQMIFIWWSQFSIKTSFVDVNLHCFGIGHLTYYDQGKFTVKQMRKPLEERRAKHFGLIAGGTGITPIMQLCKAIFRDSKDTSTTMSVLYANQSKSILLIENLFLILDTVNLTPYVFFSHLILAEEDILLRNELELLAKEYPNRFKIHYTLDRPPAGWKYSTGFINKEMLEKCMPKAASDGSTQILMCGPPPMIKFACIPNLTELGFKAEHHFTY